MKTLNGFDLETLSRKEEAIYYKASRKPTFLIIGLDKRKNVIAETKCTDQSEIEKLSARMANAFLEIDMFTIRTLYI